MRSRRSGEVTRILLMKVAALARKRTIRHGLNKMPHNIRMHLTDYSGLRPLPPAGDAGRWADQGRRRGGGQTSSGPRRDWSWQCPSLRRGVTMKRTAVTLGAALILLFSDPCIGDAQQARKVYRVGMLETRS